MGALLANLFLLLRPMLSINTGIVIAGFSFFEILTMAATAMLMAAALLQMIAGKRLGVSRIEIAMIAFIFWCVGVSLIYFQDADFKILVKWTLPLLTFMIFRRIFIYKEYCFRSLKWLLIGFSVPIVLSAAMIATGKGLYGVNYWTGLSRFSGAYAIPHEMGHSMLFFIMLSVIFIFLHKQILGRPIKKMFLLYILLMCLLASYCILKGQVRTVLVGFSIFLCTMIYFRSKAILLIVLLLSTPVVMSSSTFQSVFHDVVDVFSGDKEIEDAGSGRPGIWKRNFEVFSLKTIDRKIAGVGIGNYDRDPSWNEDVNENSNIWNSHNDWFEALFELGLVGFFLLLILYVMLYYRALSLPVSQRMCFLAVLNAVVVMNFLSNSYISRFALAQLLFILLAFIDLRSLVLIRSKKFERESCA